MTVFGAGAPSPHELGERAQAAINQGHVEEAIGWWRQAVEQAASANDTEGMGYALLNIAMASTQLGDFEAAEEAFLEAVGTGHPAIVPRALISLAIVYKGTGRVPDARQCYERVLEVPGDPDLLSQARQGLAALDRTEG
jgi:tetratricopeptide (TPR) repeat protein